MQTAEEPLAPAWTKGDTWTVRYRLRVPSMVKAPDPPPEFAEAEWIYVVDDRTPHAVHISARSDQTTWRFTFAPNGRLLSVRDPWGEDPFDAVADAPVIALGYQARRKLATEWPRFPLDEDFGLEHSGLRQRSRAAGSDREVTITREGRDAGADVVRTLTQRWQAGRPWWSALEIEAEYTDRGTTAKVVQVEGEVIAWPQSTP